MDIVFADATWLAIFKMEGNRLAIATNCDEERRPAQFTTRLSAGPERATFVRVYKLTSRKPSPPIATKIHAQTCTSFATQPAALSSCARIVEERNKQPLGGINLDLAAWRARDYFAALFNPSHLLVFN
jgi:hypothetical protein